ncbi:MAG: lysylphosphatidylglycerol synthase transmembrane domain-containing protein [Blautia sp.]
MQNKKKAIFNFIFLVFVFALTMYLIFGGEDIGEIWSQVRQAGKGFLSVGIVCVVIFIIGESVIIFYMMRTLGEPVKMGHCALYSFVGFFFSCITPSASGGQPMQIYYMKKDRIDIPVATLVLMIVTITYKAVLVFMGLLLLVFGHPFLVFYLKEYMWVFYLGLGLNVFCVTFMLILVFEPTLAKKLMVGGLKILERLHILKEKESRMRRLERSMDQYHATAAFWAEHKRIIVNVFLITLVQRCILFSVTWWVYKAMGFHGAGFFTVMLLQSVISIAVDMLPLPGGMGISEKLFLEMFVPIFGEMMLPALLLSRGISYYGQLLISAVMTCVAHFVITDDKDGPSLKSRAEEKDTFEKRKLGRKIC